MTEEEGIRRKTERRNIISSVFVSVLIGLAFQEMVPPVRESVRASGITLGTTIFFVIFFLTSMRFFIGNQLHLVSDSLLKMKGVVWFYDLLWIIIQTTVLIFLGGIASVEASRVARVSFVGLLIVLYVVDVLWIISQWLLGKFFGSWHREFIPWVWAGLNISLIVGMAIVRCGVSDPYSKSMLLPVLVMNVAAFVIDVVLSDYYDVI